MGNNYDFSILRRLRKSQGLSIADVTSISGVSTAVISRIERNQASPELNTLYSIGKALGIRGSDLLGLAESKNFQEASSQHYNSGGFQFQHIKFRNIQCFLGSALAGGAASRLEVHHNDYETCWVLSGSIEMIINEDRFPLNEGGAIQFDAVLKHTYRAVTDCKIMIIHQAKGVIG